MRWRVCHSILCKSFFTTSMNLLCGLPVFLLPGSSVFNILHPVYALSLLCTCPIHLSLASLCPCDILILVLSLLVTPNENLQMDPRWCSSTSPSGLFHLHRFKLPVFHRPEIDRSPTEGMREWVRQVIIVVPQDGEGKLRSCGISGGKERRPSLPAMLIYSTDLHTERKNGSKELTHNHHSAQSNFGQPVGTVTSVSCS
ncbi:uncharacterized protein LOC143414406 isoform X1 [Maylandia zebra]|uniref:uncharacterized protein LOC143414406 isoform X1 n=1 Tax=Maylandia zebra TaxID=106582 RepID=UPI00403C02B2